jgi:hypothetical protein
VSPAGHANWQRRTSLCAACEGISWGTYAHRHLRNALDCCCFLPTASSHRVHYSDKQTINMPHCPTCGHFLNDSMWQLKQLRVVPYYKDQGDRCDECGCLKSSAPTAEQRKRGVRIDPWGQIVGFDGQPIRLHSDRIQQHRHNMSKSGVTVVFHQTSFSAAMSIMGSQRFQPGSDGCVGQGMYFAQSPEDTHRKTRHRGVILAADVSLGQRFQVSLADSKNGTWCRTQSCQDTLDFLTGHGCE